MKTFFEIVGHSPKFSECNSGAEPCVSELIAAYYQNSGMYTTKEVNNLTARYMKLLKDFAESEE